MRANNNSIGTTNGQRAALISRVFAIPRHASWDVRMDDNRCEARKPLCTHAEVSRTDTDSANNTVYLLQMGNSVDFGAKGPLVSVLICGRSTGGM
jgi:hypothetical protein